MTTVAMSQMSHGEPEAPPGLLSKKAGASFAIAPHQTAVAVIMTNIAPAVAAASAASAMRIGVGSSTRLPAATATTVHKVKVRATSAALRQEESSVPVDAAVTLMRCEAVCPCEKRHRGDDRDGRAGERPQEMSADGSPNRQIAKIARTQVRREEPQR